MATLSVMINGLTSYNNATINQMFDIPQENDRNQVVADPDKSSRKFELILFY